jgi:ATP-dependent protease ClpP protease subunit
MEERRGYPSRHWHGQLSLGTSFWVNNVLLSFPAGLAIGALAAWITLTGDHLRGGGTAVLVAYPLLLVFNTWCIVGCWRAATAYTESGGAGLWAGLAKLLMFLGALNTLFALFFDFVPNAPSYLRMARGIDPIGNISATLSKDGSRLLLKGPIGSGDLQRLQALVPKANAVRVVELDSPGGRLKEGERIATWVRSQAWHTRTVGACESACTLVHMAGTKRQVLPGAKLGFHRASSGSYNPMLDKMANLELTRIYREAGLSESFLQRTLATPAHRMWYPSRDELVGAELIHVPLRPLDVDLPPGANPSAAEYAALMQGSDAWLAMEARWPGSMLDAGERMAQARDAGLDEAAQQVAAQRVIEGRVPALLGNVGPEQREMYLGLLIAQAQAARDTAGAPACLAVLAADAAARRALAPALAQREASWLIDAAAEPPREGSAKPVVGFTVLEQEVLRRRLGDQAPALLARSWRPGSSGATPRNALQECNRTLELLRAVAALPAAERRLAARVLFVRG